GGGAGFELGGAGAAGHDLSLVSWKCPGDGVEAIGTLWKMIERFSASSRSCHKRLEGSGIAWKGRKPYKGMQPALNDLAGGHIAMMTSPIPLALPLAHSGKVRMLGVTTKERVGAIPAVPPLAEIGVPGYDAASWWMLVAPAKTPRSIVDKLYADLRVILREPDVREEFIQRQGLIPVDSAAPDELRTFVEAEIVRLGDIVRKAGLAASE